MIIRRLASSPPPAAHQDGAACVSDWNESELLAALAASDPRAGLALYDRLIRVVEWTILRIVGRRSRDHEDLVQAAFEQIVISLHRRRYAGHCSLTSWASAVSCHIALNALRSRRREPELGVAEGEATAGGAGASVDPESVASARQVLERVRGELARMPAGRAEVLVLHEVNGLELSEIARVLGISVAAAQSRLSRGRRELLQRISHAEQS